MPNRTVKTGLKAKKIRFLQIIFFPEKQLKKQLFHVPISTFHSAKFLKKKILELIQSYEDMHYFQDKTK